MKPTATIGAHLAGCHGYKALTGTLRAKQIQDSELEL